MGVTKQFMQDGVSAHVYNEGFTTGWDYRIFEVDGVAPQRPGRFATEEEARSAMAEEVARIRSEREAK